MPFLYNWDITKKQKSQLTGGKTDDKYYLMQLNPIRSPARDKLEDRTAICPARQTRRKVLTLDRWGIKKINSCSTLRFDLEGAVLVRGNGPCHKAAPCRRPMESIKTLLSSM